MFEKELSFKKATLSWLKDLEQIEDEMLKRLSMGYVEINQIADEVLIETLHSSRILAKKILNSLKEVSIS